jgi:hypothetical protein
VSVGTAIDVLFFAESVAITSGLGFHKVAETLDRLAQRLCPWLAVS